MAYFAYTNKQRPFASKQSPAAAVGNKLATKIMLIHLGCYINFLDKHLFKTASAICQCVLGTIVISRNTAKTKMKSQISWDTHVCEGSGGVQVPTSIETSGRGKWNWEGGGSYIRLQDQKRL